MFENMQSPWDFAAYVEWLKSQGLDVGEDVAKRLFAGSMAFCKKSAQLTATPIDNIVVSVLEQFEPVVNMEIDKIDGQVG